MSRQHLTFMCPENPRQHREDWRRALWAVAHCWTAVAPIGMPQDRITAREALNAGTLPRAPMSVAFALGIDRRRLLKWTVVTSTLNGGPTEDRYAPVDADGHVVALVKSIDGHIVVARVADFSGAYDLYKLTIDILFEVEGHTDLDEAVEHIERIIGRQPVQAWECDGCPGRASCPGDHGCPCFERDESPGGLA